MTKEEKIAKIYEKIADKTLSFGCKIKDDKKHNLLEDCDIIYITQEFNGVYNIAFIKNKEVKYTTVNYKNEFKIIGHPVMIGDVLDFIYSDVTIISGTIVQRRKLGESIIKNWKYKRKPLEEQSENLINYIFDLINK